MNKKKLHLWKTLSKESILKHNKFLSVEKHKVQLPDGEVIDDWAWVEIPSAAIVLAQREDGKFLVFRYSIKACIWCKVLHSKYPIKIDIINIFPSYSMNSS